MKIVTNRCYGGFGLSAQAISEYLKLKGKDVFFYKQTKYNYKDGIEEYTKVEVNEAQKTGLFFNTVTKDLGEKFNDLELLSGNFFYDSDLKRNDPILIKVIEKLGTKANGACSNLEITEIPDNIEWEINEYDGFESIHEKHCSW